MAGRLEPERNWICCLPLFSLLFHIGFFLQLKSLFLRPRGAVKWCLSAPWPCNKTPLTGRWGAVVLYCLEKWARQRKSWPPRDPSLTPGPPGLKWGGGCFRVRGLRVTNHATLYCYLKVERRGPCRPEERCTVWRADGREGSEMGKAPLQFAWE